VLRGRRAGADAYYYYCHKSAASAREPFRGLRQQRRRQVVRTRIYTAVIVQTCALDDVRYNIMPVHIIYYIYTYIGIVHRVIGISRVTV